MRENVCSSQTYNTWKVCNAIDTTALPSIMKWRPKVARLPTKSSQIIYWMVVGFNKFYMPCTICMLVNTMWFKCYIWHSIRPNFSQHTTIHLSENREYPTQQPQIGKRALAKQIELFNSAWTVSSNVYSMGYVHPFYALAHFRINLHSIAPQGIFGCWGANVCDANEVVNRSRLLPN